ncbi:MAG: DUF983 domain-containing protein [Bacteroidetes bacterium]|nr:DUF983 domain-containing protein [Bacteroidota bacterium]
MSLKGKKLYSIFWSKCPTCHEGDLFEAKNPYNLKKAFSMVEHCPVCSQTTIPEPGFYYGAMYVSYALTVAIGCFVGVPMIFFGASALATVIAIALALIVFSPLTLRYSRMVWFNFFFDYDEDILKK